MTYRISIKRDNACTIQHVTRYTVEQYLRNDDHKVNKCGKGLTN